MEAGLGSAAYVDPRRLSGGIETRVPRAVPVRPAAGVAGPRLTPQQVDGVTEIEVGYHVRACLQGRGLATEAAAACRDHARDVLEVDRLIAIIDPRNQPSQRVAENLGLVVARTSDNRGRWTSKRLIYAASL